MTIFPTGFSPLSPVTNATKLLADDGAANGTVSFEALSGATATRLLGNSVRSFRAKVASIQSGTPALASVVMLGHSWIGQGYISVPTRRDLQRAYGDGGFGYVSFNTAANVNGLLTSIFTLTLGASWAIDTGPPSAYPGVDVSSVTSSTAGHTITLVTTAATGSTGFKIHYYKKSGGGTFSYAVDGGAATNVDTSNASSLASVVTITGLAPGAHTLTLTVVSGSVTLCGAEIHRGTTGVRVHRCGLSGSNSNVWASANLTAWATAVSNLSPDLITITMSVNDASSTSYPVATNYTNVAALVDALRAAMPTVDIVLLPECDIDASFYVNAQTIADYASSQFTLAMSKGIGWVPVCESFGTYTESDARGLMADTKHVSSLGGQVISSLLVAYITRGLRTGYIDQTADNTYFPSPAPSINGGHSNVAFGSSTSYGTLEPLGKLTTGTYNAAVGDGALGSMTTGRYSVAFGFEAGKAFNGDGLVAIGHQALILCTGAGNFGIGFQAMPALTTGTYNLAVGTDALKTVATGGGNIAVGAAAGQATTGSNGTFLGRYAGYATTGGGCTAVGNTSGGTNTSGTNNTWVGTFADNTANNFSKAIAIGYNAKAGASNACVIGGTSTDAVKVGSYGVQAPTKGFDTLDDGIRIRTSKTPASSTDTGNTGEICWDSTYLYVCVATNSWKRVMISSVGF